MAESNDSGDKTEKPTFKKLRDARKKGDVSKSRDLTSTAGLLTVLLLAAVMLPLLGAQIAALITASFELIGQPFELAVQQLGRQAMWALLAVVGLVVVPVALIGMLAEFIQVGPVMTAEKIKPKAENINPAAGLKRMFSMNNLVELIKSILKTAVVGTIAWLAMKSLLPSLPLLVETSPQVVGAALWHVSWTLLSWAVGAFVLISAMDLAWQRYSFLKKMRMSLRDIRQETKESEGDPHLKGQRRQLQQEWAQQGATQNAARAHVLVVNPTHVAIAIDYHREHCPVPTVIAKGEDADALAMRNAAHDAGVPVLRNIKLARQLLADTETGGVVPAELFDIIATVILWAQDVHHELAVLRGDVPADAKPRSRRAPPGVDLTRYDRAAAGARGRQHQGTGSRWRFARYVSRHWHHRAERRNKEQRP